MNIHLALLMNWYERNAHWFLPVAIVGVAIVANGVSMYFEDGVCDDAAKYHLMITNWMKSGDIYLSNHDEWASAAIPPFFFWIVKSLTLLFHVEIFTAARELNFVCGMLSPLIFFYILNTFEVKKIFAFFCAVTLACHPSAVYISTIMTRDCLYFFLVMLTILLLAQGTLKKQIWQMFLAGIVFSAAAFTRYEALEILPCFIIFLVCCRCEKKISWQMAFVNLGIFVLFVLVGFLIFSFIMDFHPEYCRQIYTRYYERLMTLL